MKKEFIDFCRTKGDEPFDFYDIQNCALAQFGKAKFGRHFWSAGARHISTEHGRIVVLTLTEAIILRDCTTFSEVVNALG